MEKNRYFTVAEANALIPALEQSFGRILQMRAQLRGVYQTMEQLGESPSPETLARQDGTPELRSARGKFRGLMEALQEEIAAVTDTGVQIKDLDTGLCDFLGRRSGRDVFLCWQYGEKRIGFWHDLTTGFAGRQPVQDGDEDLGPSVMQ